MTTSGVLVQRRLDSRAVDFAELRAVSGGEFGRGEPIQVQRRGLN